MSKQTSKRNKKFYNMRGCSRKTCKNHLGGSSDAPLAYTGQKINMESNPFFAYTGKGGSSCGLSNLGNIPQNINAANPSVPNTGPPILQTGTPIWNQASQQLGGCGGTCPLNPPTPIIGGNCGNSTSCGAMIGGVRHRNKCKCSKCKKRIMKGGNAGIPYPNGLVGSPWTPNVDGWPGVDGISGNRNYLTNNSYDNYPKPNLRNVEFNPPLLRGGKKNQKGGTLSNLLGQDLINLGRQFQFGIGTAYNALAGYAAPVNPLPWKDQLPNKYSINPRII